MRGELVAAVLVSSLGCAPPGSIELTTKFGPPNELEFGPSVPGQTKAQGVFVRSHHTEMLSLRATVTNPAFQAVLVEGPDLPPGKLREVAVIYAPTAEVTGREEGWLTVTSDWPELGATLAVSGVPTEVDCTVPFRLDFGVLARGDTSRLSLAVNNASRYQANAALSLFSNQFAIEGPASFALAPGETRAVPLTFNPTELGDLGGTLGVRRHEQLCPDALVQLTGRSVVALLSSTPSSVDFGEVTVGATRRITIELSNVKLAPLTLEAFEMRERTGVSSVFGGPTTVPVVVPQAETNASGELVPGKVSLEVTFTPTAPRPYLGQFCVTVSGAPKQPVLCIDVSGAGTP